MPTPSIEEFWQLMQTSGLLGPAEVAPLKAEFGNMRGASASGARTLCEWLIDRRALSRFQCDVLLLGQPGPFHYGDYRVWDRVTQGRLAGLFRAVHLPTGQAVMLQFLSGPAAFDAERVAAAQVSAATWAQLSDPHVSTCFELLQVGEYKFVVLEDLYGQSAQEMLLASRKVPPAHACAWVRSAALALAAMHARQWMHGDVRPENIWCSPSGAAQLLGFPLSRDPLIPAGGIDRRPVELDLRTAPYSAAELVEYGSTLTPLSDLYALGCTLYELLTGRPPFADGAQRQTIAQIMARHASEAIVPVDLSGPMPEGLNRLVSFLMAKNPAVRFAQAAAVAEALAPYAAKAAAADLTPGESVEALKSFCRQRGPNEAVAPIGGAMSAAFTAGQTFSPRASVASPPSPAGAGNGSAPPTPLGVSPTARQTFPGSAVSAGAARMIGTATGGAPVGNVGGSGAPMPLEPAPFGPSVEEVFRYDFGFASPNVATQVKGAFTPDKPPPVGMSPRKRLALTFGLILAAVALLVGGLLAVEHYHPSTAAEKLPEKPAETAKTPEAETQKEDGTKEPEGPAIIADDGHTLWTSPTHGEAPQIKYFAPGVQVLAVLRPQSLLGSPRGRQTIEAMGPAGAVLLSWIETQVGVKPEAIDRLDIAIYESFGARPLVSLVAYLKTRPKAEELIGRWGNPTPTALGRHTIYQKDDDCHYLPPGDKHVIVVAPRARLDDILANEDSPATLDPNLASLVETADEQRHVTLFFLPAFLRSARETLYPGELASARDALDWFLGASEDMQAGAISFELSDPSFAELRMYPARSTKPVVMARQFHERIDLWSPKIQNHLVSLTISPYSRDLLSQFPFMLQTLARFTRHGAQDRFAVVRLYLPGAAAANLAAATDLLLLETTGTAKTAAPTAEAAPKSVWDRLGQPVTVTFDRDSLENALKMLSTEMGVKIEIVGNDLKLDGITKNQPLGLDMRKRPAQEVLNQIMLLANPDRTVKKLSDDVQKLVYVVKPKGAGGEDVILITTRAKAAEHGDLPPVFKK